jgi:polyisoprenoid-binding protein YceI
MTRFVWGDLSKIEIQASSSLHPIHASTSEVLGYAAGDVRDGAIVLDNDPTGYVEVAIASLRSWNPLEDVAMRRAVHASKHPVLRFDLTRAAGGPDVFTVEGSLTMNGVTRELTTDVKASVDGGWLTANGEHTFDVTDFGVTPPSIFGLRVHPAVRVIAHLVGREEG